jgi:hypothetical protein
MPVVDGVNNLFASLVAHSSLSMPVVDVANNSACTMKHEEAEKGEKESASSKKKKEILNLQGIKLLRMLLSTMIRVMLSHLAEFLGHCCQ